VAAGQFLNQPLVGAGLFMHERKTHPSGNERLVIVQGWLGIPFKGPHRIGLQSDSYKPAKWSLNCRIGAPNYHNVDQPFAEEPVRLYAGQIDPVDPSRFTIPFDTLHGRSVLHGRLLDNDSIVWEITPVVPMPK
jgi:hypothetical protein